MPAIPTVIDDSYRKGNPLPLSPVLCRENPEILLSPQTWTIQSYGADYPQRPRQIPALATSQDSDWDDI